MKTVLITFKYLRGLDPVYYSDVITAYVAAQVRNTCGLVIVTDKNMWDNNNYINLVKYKTDKY